MKLPFFARLPLLWQMTLLTLIAGTTLWGGFDYFQTRQIKARFEEHQMGDLERASRQDRMRFHQLLQNFQSLAQIVVSHHRFIDYVRSEENSLWRNTKHSLTHRVSTTPPWFPGNSILRSLIQPRLALLLDAKGEVREIYHQGGFLCLPPPLRQPGDLLLAMSQNEAFLVQIGDEPYVLAAQDAPGKPGEPVVTLLLASPIDDAFLANLKNHASTGLMVILDGERNPTVLASSNPQLASRGMPFEDLSQRFLVTGLESLDHGASELGIKIAFLISRQEMDLLSRSILVNERQARLLLAMVLIGAFLVLLAGFTGRVRQLHARMAQFSREELGEIAGSPLATGDEIARLDQAFRHLAEQIRIAHARLSKQAGEMRGIVEKVGDALVIVNEQGRITTFNPAAESLFGYTSAEMVGQPLILLLPRESHAAHLAGFQRFLATGHPDILSRRMELAGLRRDGTSIPLSLTLSAMETGEDRLFIASLRDITLRKQFEASLKASEARFRTLVETIPHGIEECDTDGIITFSNPAHARLHGATPAQITGRRVWELYPVEDRDLVEARFRDILRHRPDPAPFLHDHLTRDGRTITVQVDWSYRLTPQGEMKGLISIITDVTERKRADERIRQQQEELAHASRIQITGQVASGLAHELNQPLAAIVNYATGASLRLRSGLFEARELADVADRIAGQAERMGQVVRSLRHFLQRGESRKRPTDLRIIAREAVQFADFSTRRNGVAVRYQEPDTPLMVLADPIQIAQVILNLMQNGVEAMREGSEEIKVLTLAMGRIEREIWLSVADTGPGVPEEDRVRLFDPFFTTKKEGMGLGLSISRSILHNHDGELSFFNRAESGAVFEFRLPWHRLGNRPGGQ